MTSFTKALYRRDPKAADAFHKAQQFESMAAHGRPGQLQYGKHVTLACFTPAFGSNQPAQPSTPFGKRELPPSAAHACKEGCGHPACSHGCVLRISHDPVKHPEHDVPGLDSRRRSFMEGQ